MKKEPYVIDALHEHIAELAPKLRQSDIEELKAVGSTPEEALETSFAMTGLKWSIMLDGEVIGMFGAVCNGNTALNIGASPWLLGADELERWAVRWVRHSRKYIIEMFRKYPVLSNYVDARNTESIKWLRWCGFTIHEAKPYGKEKMPFHKFELRRTRKCVNQ